MRSLISTMFLLMITAATPFALQIPDKKIQITVGDHASAWYQNPMWIAIGILAIVVVLLLVMVSRRGGNTSIRS